MTIKRRWLTLADADDLWLDRENYVWFYNDEMGTWNMLMPRDMGGWAYLDSGEPNEDECGPFTRLHEHYRGNEVEE